MNRKIATAVAAGVTAIGSLTMGLAAAAPAGAATTPATATHASTLRHELRVWLRHHRALRRAVVTISAETLNITRADLVAELRSGKSIADVATEHGVTPQAVVDALVSRGESYIMKLEREGKLTSTRAAKLVAALPSWAADLVAHQFGPDSTASGSSSGGTTAG